MPKPRNAVYVLVAACSLVMAACQPAEAPAARSAKSLDSSASKIVAQINKAADNDGAVVDSAKK